LSVSADLSAAGLRRPDLGGESFSGSTGRQPERAGKLRPNRNFGAANGRLRHHGEYGYLRKNLDQHLEAV